MMQLKTLPFLAAVAATAFLARLAFLLAVGDLWTGPSGPPSADPVEFNALAIRVAQGDGYVNTEGQPTSFRAPGFPLFVAAIYGMIGQAYPLVYGTFCLLGALACVFTYFLARELVPERSARLAAILGTLYVPQDSSVAPRALAIDLAGLAPGRYQIEVDVTPPGGRTLAARREIRIERP